MTYEEATQYLFDAAPMFQNVGAAAYKEGLGGTLALDEYFGHPHRRYRTIHVGGTNGKGSVCHTLAAILQAQGYRVGLYTSPHLIDFRERIRVNGEMISKERVIEFVKTLSNSLLNGESNSLLPLSQGGSSYSFFELATALAFQYFAEQNVDFAVIEVGLGGRLDCTNIIRPELSVVTNISFDHIQFLGDTLPKIAAEKAGIIKPGIPAVIGENVSPEVKAVFRRKAEEVGAPITFAEDEDIQSPAANAQQPTIDYQLKGLCQEKNRRTILTAVSILRRQGIVISDEAVKKGFEQVIELTGLMGRWQKLGDKPLTICDTAHNTGGLQYIFRHLASLPHRHLHLVLGMVSDKDVDAVLSMLKAQISSPYSIYFTQASVRRAMPADELAKKAEAHNLHGTIYNNVESAFISAKANAEADDIIYIGGSTFVVADLLSVINAGK